MANPFPGMDPFIEAANMWSSVHHHLISEICSAINLALPAKYVATVEERCYPADEGLEMYPDIKIQSVSEEQAVYGEVRKRVAAMRLPEPIEIEAATRKFRVYFLRVVCANDTSRVVAEIEVFSPANKKSGNGRTSYLEKQRTLLNSNTHFLEIDLLRDGQHTIACPKSELQKYGIWDYATCLHKGDAGDKFNVWLGTLRHKLPVVHIPLEKPKDEVSFDLQAIFNKCYDGCAIAKRVKYSRPAVPPLSPEDAAWANEILKEKNLR
ncbi:MAG TPA: DUF4058 family protein [Planctomycetota bacterium]|nr:DUF4058 family protein [Planctomycetota bacterium]